MTPDRPQAKRPSRRMIPFYVAAGTVLALVGLGVFLYRPLRLSYTLHRLSTTTQDELASGEVPAGDYVRWWEECTREACAGDRRATETVVSLSRLTRSDAGDPSFEAAYRVAAANGQQFFEVLSEQTDEACVEVLNHVLWACRGTLSGWMATPDDKLAIAGLKAAFEDVLRKSAEGTDPHRVGEAALGFIGQRLAGSQTGGRRQ